MNYLDLFSGIGGFALGAYNAGWRFDKHYFSEVDDYAIRVYRQRFPDAIPLGDITEIDARALADTESTGQRSGIQGQAIKLDRAKQGGNTTQCSQAWIITGGFPCQDISVAGKGEGIGGSRSGLWFEMWRIIRDLRPRYVIAENVGAITFRGLNRVLSSLAEIGYDVEWQDIRASDVGAPHRRERIWIVAYSQEAIRRGDDGTDNPGRGNSEARGCGITGCGLSNWATEPNMGRVAHGVQSRIHRLKCLGNSIVPQIAELLFRQIANSAALEE